MRLAGRLHDWDDARGFGFVTPNGGGERAFVHIRAFESRSRRPVEGDLLSYATSVDARGRRNAVAVRFAPVATQASARAQQRVAKPFRATGFASLFALALVALAALHRLPWGVPLAYAVLSGATYFAYLADKSAALRGRRRTPERTLHTLALLGGWPGAAFAQQHFAHKRSKAAFVETYRATVVANVLALVAAVLLRAHPEWLP